MIAFLLVVWALFLILILIDWTVRIIERRKVKKMSELERMIYLTDKYGMRQNWPDYYDELCM